MEEEALARELGTLIRRLRFEKGYSQEGLAEACNLERAYVGMIERGEVNVSVKTAFKLAKGLDLRLSNLFSRLEQKLDDLNGG